LTLNLTLTLVLLCRLFDIIVSFIRHITPFIRHITLFIRHSYVVYSTYYVVYSTFDNLTLISFRRKQK
jgi:hypothetical protein